MDFRSFDMLSVGILAINISNEIVYLNNAYASFLEMPKYKVLNQPVRKILPHTNLDNVCRTGKAEIGVWQKTKRGYLFGNRLPIIEDGKVVGALAELVLENDEVLDTLKDRLNQIGSKVNYLTDQLKNSIGMDKVIYHSEEMTKVIYNVMKIAPLFDTVLLTGETGTGKEVVAEMLWQHSGRSNAHFLKINCAALPNELIESELFGYEKGAFTGANQTGKPGKFEMADGGILFLDEITSMPMSMQAKLLRVLQDKEVERLGSNRKKKVDIKILAASNANIPELIRKQQFREDLYYRLNVVNIHVPPLRERKTDVLLLADYFLDEYAKQFNRTIMSIAPDVVKILENYYWPGNVRELKNMMERFIIICDSPVITYNDMMEYAQFIPVSSMNVSSFRYAVSNTEKNVIFKALEQCNGNKSKTAKLLGINRSTLYTKLSRFNDITPD
ncbi:MAG: sigma 54-interacting transcriptional regulator [Treponema sp.]|nr:sigma 54-interacting transcriptional regulator [Treponema sp.]